MDPRSLLQKINTLVDHDGPSKTLTITWKEARALRDLITEMNLRGLAEGAEMDMAEWEKICRSVATKHSRTDSL